MAISVKLSDVVEAMDLPNQDWQSYLNPDTGEIVTVTDEERRLVEDGENLDDLPGWQQETLPKAREALESHRFLVLPGSFEIPAWSILERFAQGQSGDRQADELPILCMVAAHSGCSAQLSDGWASKTTGTGSVSRRSRTLRRIGWRLIAWRTDDLA